MSDVSLLALAAGYARQALAPATLRAYASDWAAFAAWCQARGIAPPRIADAQP